MKGIYPMKKNKNVFIIIAIITTMFLMLCSCSNDTNTSENNESDPVPSFDPAPLTIWIYESADLKSELLNKIESSRTFNEEDEEHGVYTINKIYDIKEFYYPALEIDGFELFCIAISEAGFVFYYGPVDKLNGEETYHFSNHDGIEIIVERPEWQLENVPYSLYDIARGDGNTLTKDGFVHGGENHIFGRIEDTIFRISVPKSQNNYDYLRDLAFQLIETAELVIIED